MTLIKDSMDEWLETALNFIRDQLRVNTSVGLQASNGLRQVEVGDVLPGALAKHLDGAPTAWIAPRRDARQRRGNVIEHTVRVDVEVHVVAPLQDLAKYADAQSASRIIGSRVYNEALNLRDAGATAGVWDDWTPVDALEWRVTNAEEHDILTTTIPFEFLIDRIWIQGGA